MSKFCRQCGAQLEDDAVKCEACGLELQQEPENNQQSVNAEADAQPQEGAPAPKKLNNRNIAIIAVAAVVVIIVLIVALTSGGGYKSAINNYIDVMIKGKVDKIEKLAPKEYWEYYEDTYDKDIDDVEKEAEDMVELIIDMLEDGYGKNIKVSYKVTKEDKLTESELNKIREGANSKYEITRKSITEGYEIDADMTIKGDDDEMTSEGSAVVVKINGSWYLADFSGNIGPDAGLDGLS